MSAIESGVTPPKLIMKNFRAVVVPEMTLWVAGVLPDDNADRYEPADPTQLIAETVQIAQDRHQQGSSQPHVSHVLCLDHAALGSIVLTDVGERLLGLTVSGPAVKVFPVLGNFDYVTPTLPMGHLALACVARAVRMLVTDAQADVSFLTPMLAQAVRLVLEHTVRP